MNKPNTHDKLKALLQFDNEAEKNDFEAVALAMSFLSLIETEMNKLGHNKQVLAKMVGTSPSYITQMFRGDRLPNFKMLAKMQKALDLTFKISTTEIWKTELKNEVMEYHNRWSETQNYLKNKGSESNYTGVMALVTDEEENPYALAS